MRILDCPACQKTLIAVEYGDVEVDCCPACEGVWLDGGELEALVGQPTAPAATPDAGLGPPDRGCPICVDNLVKERYGRTDVVVDKCPNGHGVWLDKGELESILAAYGDAAGPPAGPEDHGAAALGNFFGTPRSGPAPPPEGREPDAPPQ